MNKKFYVPFETAKMLKKAGYPQAGSDMYYNPNGELFTRTELEAGYNEEYPIMITYYYTAPAYCEVLDWLVESKEICIDIEVLLNGKWVCSLLDKKSEFTIGETLEYPTREQAINAAIVRVLEELQ